MSVMITPRCDAKTLRSPEGKLSADHVIPLELGQTLETELLASQAKEHQLRNALKAVAEDAAVWLGTPEQAGKLVDLRAALATTPEPVIPVSVVAAYLEAERKFHDYDADTPINPGFDAGWDAIVDNYETTTAVLQAYFPADYKHPKT